MNIIPNPTLLLLQLLPFAVTIAGLYLILFKPMFAYLEERDEASTGATDTAKDLESEVQAKKAAITERVQAALKESSETRSAARQEMMAEYNNFVQTKRQEAEKQIKEAAQTIAVEKAAARQEVHVQAEAFANDIASKVIGRSIA
jgi:F-type H+-transporting ATPase subunit b